MATCVLFRYGIVLSPFTNTLLSPTKPLSATTLCDSLPRKESMVSLSCLTLKQPCFPFEDVNACLSKKKSKAQPFSHSSSFACWAEKESRDEFEVDADKAREALKQLDQQIQFVSDKKARSPMIKDSLRKLPCSDWNLVIKNHAKSNDDGAIISTYSEMESRGVSPERASLPLILKACAKLNDVERGRAIHRRIQRAGLAGDLRVGTALVDFYGKSGLVDDARRVFNGMRERDVVLWNAMIYGYVKSGCFEEAISLFPLMRNEGLKANSRTVVGLLLASKEFCGLRLGREIHGYCLRNHLFDSNPHVGTALLGFYSKFDVKISRSVFNSMSVKNIVSWNVKISGCVDAGENFEACLVFISLLHDGVKFDSVTILAVLQACIELGFLDLGMQIHQMAVKSGLENDLFIVNTLLNLYSECGSLELAFRLFENAPDRDLALWNSMIDAYIKCGVYDEAEKLFIDTRKDGIGEDERSIAIMLPSCSFLVNGLRKGESLHAHVIKSGMNLGVSLGNAFLGIYADMNCVDSAGKVFDEMTGSDVVSWNVIIMALASNGLRNEAWRLFEEMRSSDIKPNSHTMISILTVCDEETCLGIGKSLHGFVVKHGIEVDLPLTTSLTDMYMSCGDEATATYLFEGFSGKDVISWNACIASYIKNDRSEKVLLLFRRMVLEMEPNSATIVNMLALCTNLAALLEGKSLHAYITKKQSFFGFDFALANALITMYTRSGSMQSAERVFKLLPKRDIVSWNTIITGYSLHGRGEEAVISLSLMIEEGFRPNSSTFAAILSACRHCGFIEEGLRLFHTMAHDFKVKPELVHYGCVVDLLCRGSRLTEARDFIESTPFEADASLWRALLSACRDRNNTELATIVFEKLVELDPMNPGNYVLISNIYASAGLWSEVRKVRLKLREMGLRKSPGISWIVVQSRAHCFAAGDTSHAQSETIYENLRSLTVLIKESGYVPDFRLFSHYKDDQLESRVHIENNLKDREK